MSEKLKILIDGYGRACRRDGNPAWESEEGKVLLAALSDAAQATHVKPEAKLVTFDEFVQYGRDHGANIVNGMPWSFTFNGHAVTHENDDLYSIGCPSIKFRRGEVLVATAFGDSRLIQVLQPPAQQATVTGDDYAAFEAWAKDEPFDLSMVGSIYTNAETCAAWHGWRNALARATHPTK